MAQKKKAAPARKKERSFDEADIRKKEIIGIAVIAVSVLLLLNFIVAPKEYTAEISSFGVVSWWLVKALRFLAGHAAVTLPVFMLCYGILICAGKDKTHIMGRLVGIALIFLAVVGYLQLSAQMQPFGAYIKTACGGSGGGLFGALIDFAFLKTVGKIGAVIILTAMLIVGILETFQTSLKRVFSRSKEQYKKVSASVNESHERHVQAREERAKERAAREVAYAEPPIVSESPEKNELVQEAEAAPVVEPAPEPQPVFHPQSARRTGLGKQDDFAVPAAPDNDFFRDYAPVISGSGSAAAADTYTKPPVAAKKPAKAKTAAAPAAEDETEKAAVAPHEPVAEIEANDVLADEGYRLPPIDLIDSGGPRKNSRMDQAITNNISVLESTLHSFGVKATVTQVVAGPAVIRYELQPAPGVKVARITSLADDIALSLAAQSVRIEAPIPGKSAIGIEVARKDRDTVYFREMIESDNFQNAESKLTVVLGKNISGECVVTDLTKMPHLLIAGTTGSGKSVCINALICSILYKAKPDEVKMMLIDPKKVELTNYANLPHLIAPVINDSKKASNALKWIVNEMENRYTLFAGCGVKDIKGYNAEREDAPMCKIVVIIDELADLMMVAKKDVEDSICRIAQLARAAGIHLVVATQRPSVDVITGLIKANIPSRIAFTVSSPVDSRTILDCGGAEKLLGNGDMLFDPIASNKPIRIQGSFINEKDVRKLVDYCAEQASPSFSQEAVESVNSSAKAAGGGDDELDDLFYEAGMLIINTGQASTSFLQRRLAIGNPRAARLMDMLEAKGVVGGPNGSKPRDVLMSLDEFEEIYG